MAVCEAEQLRESLSNLGVGDGYMISSVIGGGLRAWFGQMGDERMCVTFQRGELRGEMLGRLEVWRVQHEARRQAQLRHLEQSLAAEWQGVPPGWLGVRESV